MNFGNGNIYKQSGATPRTNLLSQTPVRDAIFNLGQKNYFLSTNQQLNELTNCDIQEINTYKTKYDTIEILKNKISNISIKTPEIQETLKECLTKLDELEAELYKLQTIEGSDDNDLERAKDYNEKLKNPQHI